MSRLLIAAICFLLAFSPLVAGSEEAAAIDIPPLPEDAADPNVDVLTRGPVHEAFAEQVSPDPMEGITAPTAPPDPIPEIPPEVKPEGDDVMWIPGYWFWDEERRDYLWVSGVWRRVPPGRRWVPGYWQTAAEGYRSSLILTRVYSSSRDFPCWPGFLSIITFQEECSSRVFSSVRILARMWFASSVAAGRASDS